MYTREPFSPRQGSTVVVSAASMAAGITIDLTKNIDKTVRLLLIGGTISSMVRLDRDVASAKATSIVTGAADTPVVPGVALLLNRGANGGVITIGPGVDGNPTGNLVIQTGSGGVA